MPFPSAITSGQKTALRAADYTAAPNVAYCPNEIVFQCLTNAIVASGTFAEFAWDTASVGAYTNVKVGQTVFIGGSSDPRYAYFVGRVRKAPTSTTFYINESAIVLQENQYVTVIDDYRLWEKLGRVTDDGTIYVDWDVTYAAPAPCIYNLQSAYVNPVSSGSASWAFSPLANAIADGASISSWLWDVDDGTITVGSTTTQNITVSFPQGFRWVRVTATSSNGQTNYFVFAVWVGETYTIQNLSNITISTSLDAGYTANMQAFDTDSATVLRSLYDETLICIYSQDSVATDLSGTPVLTNVNFVGRLINETDETVGTEQHSELQTISFEAQGIAALAAGLPSAQLILEDSASPSTWLQVVKPTPTRFIAHLATRYSTLSNVAALQFNSANDVYISKSLQVEGTSLGANLDTIAGFINAKLNYAPSGEIQIERNAFYLVTGDRSSLTTVMDFDYDEGDLFQFAITREYHEKIGEATVGAEIYNRTTGVTDYALGKAPPTALGAGEFTVQLDGLTLEEGLDASEAATALNVIAGSLYADAKNEIIMTVRVWDAWRNILVPTCFQWYTFDIPASSNARGLVYGTNDFWQLQECSIDIDNVAGRNIVQGRWRLEPELGNAQIVSSVIPPNAPPSLPVVPSLDAYAGLPSNPLINYPSDNPTDNEIQPIDPTSGNSAYSPLPSDEAYNAGANAGKPKCRPYNVFLSNSGNVTGFTSSLGADYLLTIEGSGITATSSTVLPFDFVTSSGGWTHPNPPNRGTYTLGQGHVATTSDTASLSSYIRYDLGAAYTVTSVAFTYTASGATYVPGDGKRIILKNAALGNLLVQDDVITNGTNVVYSWSGSQALVRYVDVDITIDNSSPFTGSGVITAATITYDNPSGTAVYSDAFYYWQEGQPAQAMDSFNGFYIQNAKFSPIPLYNPQHKYTVEWTGDGNPILMRFADSTSHADNQNVPLLVTICGTGAGNFTR